MAGLPRSFNADVTENIMRFAVGYPRDRLRSIASAIERREKQYVHRAYVGWAVNTDQLTEKLPTICNWSRRGPHKSSFGISFDTSPPKQVRDQPDGPKGGYDYLDDRSHILWHLYFTCEACEMN